jgi:O-antigen/teichoic acid export membrane protein
VPWNVFYTLVASFSGMAHSGELRALLNFALPMAQTYAAFSLLFLPHAASLHEDKGWSAVRRDSHRITMLFLLGGMAYWIFVCSFRSQLIHLLYAGQYGGIADLLPWIGLASLMWGAAHGPALALRARKSPVSVFVMYLASAIVALVIGVPGTLKFGLGGAVTAMLLSSGAALITGIVLVAKQPSSEAELCQAA